MVEDNSEREPLGEIELSRKEANSEYKEIARLAYANALDLYDEAKFLLQERKSPRAFALAVASIEELIKSVVYDSGWKQDIDPDLLLAESRGKKKSILLDHATKHQLYGLFLLYGEARKEGRKKAEEVFETLKTTGTTASLTLERKAEIDALITTLEGRRLDSLYVGVELEEGRVKTPKGEITLVMCQDLVTRIEQFIPFVESHLKLGREAFPKQPRKSHDLGERRTNH